MTRGRPGTTRSQSADDAQFPEHDAHFAWDDAHSVRNDAQ
jgi:hypothetical protein